MQSVGTFVMSSAAVVGLMCAMPAGLAGLFAAGWHAAILLCARHPVAPKLGSLALGLAGLYGLAAVAGFGGSDPEDVGLYTSAELGSVAVGCALVGCVSVVVWLAADLSSSR